MAILNVLMCALHPLPSKYIGGGWVRTIEILRRAKVHGVNYVVIENPPLFRDVYGLNYESCEVSTIPTTRIGKVIAVARSVMAGMRAIRQSRFNLIVSPVEQNISILPAYILSKLTRIPWTVVLQSAPVYWVFPTEKLRHRTSTLKDLYLWFRYEHKLSLLNSITAAIINWVVFKILESAPLLLCVNRSIKDDMGIIDPNVRILTVDPSWAVNFDEMPEATEAKEYDAISILAYPHKNDARNLIDIWRLVVRQKSKTCLVIAGKTTSEIYEMIKNKITECGLAGLVFLANDLREGLFQAEGWAYMKMSRIYIHPSGFGGGLTIAEALACGLLVIAYDTPLVRYAYGKCPAVFLTPHGDVEAFARKFTKLINDTSLLRRYSVIATQYAKRHCNWEDVVESEKRAYLKVLEECHLR